MASSINSLSEPVGAFTSWLRPNNTTPLPFGWLICDGSTVVDSESLFNGETLPDLRARFPRGHATLTNANFAADVLYYTGGTVPTGGVDTNNLSHSHNVTSHRHNLPAVTTSLSNAGGTPNIFGPDSTLGNHSHLTNATLSNYSGTYGTNSALGSVDNRPAFTETVTIIKVK